MKRILLPLSGREPHEARRDRALYLRVLLAGTMFGTAYGGLVSVSMGGTGIPGAPIGFIQGALLSAIIGGVEVFAPRTRLGRLMEQAPFLMTTTIKGLLYGTVITLVVGGELGARIVGARRPAGATADFTPLSVALSFAVTFAFMIVLQIGQLVGGRTLRDIVLGRYHRPRAEERFFLFVDIAGSTPLAERLGPVAVHRFLGRVFRVASQPIDAHQGEIYQYVGDEMVITWTVLEGRPGARPLACFFAIERALAAARPRFEREFSAVPGLRAALHAGPVVTGEVGVSRRAIVFHGDVMNTAARLEQAARELDRRFLVSGDALAQLPPADGWVLEDLGPRSLRGRAAPVHVWAVHEATTTT
jgi:adenylate cyclase